MGDYAIDDSPESSQINATMDSNGHHDGHASSTNGYRSLTPYTVDERPLGSSKHLRVICVGAGVSGINLVRTLRLNLKDYDMVVYEKNQDVGGTWFENRYPGCKCDIPSHCYQFSWRPNKEWSNFFAAAEEIKAYLCQVCNEEDITQSIRLSHQVLAARWDEEQGHWSLRIRNMQTGEEFHDHADFLINGCGILNNWKWPDVEGLHDFRGDLIHTASWPEAFDYSNKTVAVIGNGSSGVQLLPAIQPDAQKLYHIVRTPTWITPPWRMAQLQSGRGQILKEIAVDHKEDFLPEQIQKFKEDDAFYRRAVKSIEKDTGANFPLMIKDGPVQAYASAKVREYMTMMLGGDERLCQTLIPTFPIGTRRVTSAPGYLEALRQENVQVVGGEIRRFLADGIEMASGEVLKVDAIICATGFDLSFCPRFPLVGREGNLQDIWKDGVPQAYMSVAVAGVPNYFTFLGPNAPIGHGSVVTLSEHIAKYITRVLKKVQSEHIRTIVPSRAAVDEYNEHITNFMPRTTWAAPGRSWFKMGKEHGSVVALHPGSRVHFFHMLETLRAEDYEYTFDGGRRNRFGYLGNGFSSMELEEGHDVTWYLDDSAVV